MMYLLTPSDHHLIQILWLAEKYVYRHDSLRARLDRIEPVLIRHVQTRHHLETLSQEHVRRYKKQILHAVAAHAILDGKGADSVWGRMIQVLYYRGGGYTSLLDHGRLCICMLPTASVVHTSLCERFWRVYQTAISTLFPLTPDAALTANRLCILDTTGMKKVDAERQLQALVAQPLGVPAEALQSSWWTVEAPWLNLEDELACLQDDLCTHHRILSRQRTVLVLQASDALTVMPLALALLQRTGISPILVPVHWTRDAGWQLPS